MIERDLYSESDLDDEGPSAARHQQENLQESSARPLDCLPVQDRAFFRVLYGLELSWPDLEYLADLTGRPVPSLGQQLRDLYARNMRRRTGSDKLMEKIASAYSRLTELTREEHTLEESLYALSLTQPVDTTKRRTLLFDLERTRKRIAQLRGQQEKWRAESANVLRLPSKEVSVVFNLNPAAVDQRAVRIGRRLRALSRQ
jgi:hypothetical protein